jgi:hypothetical protein
LYRLSGFNHLSKNGGIIQTATDYATKKVINRRRFRQKPLCQ